jgi:uncharacterized protein YndB with AHSA1/START domain
MSDYATVERIAQAAAVGEVVREEGRVGLRFERHYPHPIERVWSAITESEHVRHWMPCDLVGERREGAEITLPFGRDEVEKYNITEPVLTGRIEIWQPTSVFQWTWDKDVLRFELSPAENGTRLVFTTWPESQDLEALADSAGGYHLCLAELAVLLDGEVVPSVTDIDTIAFGFEKTYRQRLGLD